MDSVYNKKRLAKNTLLLYARTFIVMSISLFTSRIVLDSLGIENYGIYNIVCGFVALFSIISSTLTSTTQRFLTFELGKKEKGNSNKVFSVTVSIHILLIVLLLVLFETIGLWFLNFKLNIPDGRMIAANCAYQCAVLTFVLNIFTSPYTASIIAHEKMGVFAYVGLIEVILKLIIVYFLYITSFDRLIVYSILLLVVSSLMSFINLCYCSLHFEETKFKFIYDKKMYGGIVGFACVNFVGAFASILSNQGINILFNIFYGVVVNAAQGIAMQVQNAVIKFVSDFTTALNPQITKSFAYGDVKESVDLAFMGSKFSFYLLLILTTPIILHTSYILDLWLGKYPDYTVNLVRLSLVFSLVSVLSSPIITVFLASNKIKRNTICTGGLRLLILPIAYVFLSLGNGPVVVYYIIIIMEVISLATRLVVFRKEISIPISLFYKSVISKIIPVSFLVVSLCYLMKIVLPDGFFWFVLSVVLCFSFTLATIFSVGITSQERQKAVTIIKKKINSIM